MNTTSRLYYEPARTSVFSTLLKLLSATVAAAKKKLRKKKKKGTSTMSTKSVDDIRAWLEVQDTYTLLSPVFRT